MIYILRLSVLVLLVLAVFAAPTAKLAVKRSSPEGKPDRYIVVLKDDASKKAHIESLTNSFPTLAENSGSELVYDYSIINAYAAILKGDALDSVLSDPSVAFVEADGPVSIGDLAVEKSSSQGEIQMRAAHDPAGRDSSSGSGVVLYGIDTGIYIEHDEFGGRAYWGITFGGYDDTDGNGHGTFTAAIAVGAKYGSASNATIMAVRVLDNNGSGQWSDVIAGVNWSVKQAVASGTPSIVAMSLGGSNNLAIDLAVEAGIKAGVHFTLAAGNDFSDAANVSPAHVPGANTVAAVNSLNIATSWSNWGSVVDVWYYGDSITSAWVGYPKASFTGSGTSAAAPGVAGILAVAIGKYGNKSPADLTADLVAHARPIVTGARIPPTTNRLGSLW